MKEECKELYDYIVNTHDKEKMHVLGEVMKSMMCNLIDSHPGQAREYLDMLQSVKWHNYLTTKESAEIVVKMQPEPAWSRGVWDSVMNNFDVETEEEPYYNEDALYVTMCMISSDSGATITEMLNSLMVNIDKETYFRFIYQLALDKLKDKDKMFNIRSYFQL